MRTKRRHFLHVRREIAGIMAQAWFTNRRGKLVKHVMRYLSAAEYEAENKHRMVKKGTP